MGRQLAQVGTGDSKGNIRSSRQLSSTPTSCRERRESAIEPHKTRPTRAPLGMVNQDPSPAFHPKAAKWTTSPHTEIANSVFRGCPDARDQKAAYERPERPVPMTLQEISLGVPFDELIRTLVGPFRGARQRNDQRGSVERFEAGGVRKATLTVDDFVAAVCTSNPHASTRPHDASATRSTRTSCDRPPAITFSNLLGPALGADCLICEVSG
jgi:hypothetical protein